MASDQGDDDGDWDVENTNLEASRSKYSLIDQGYRTDPFLPLLLPPSALSSACRSPAVNRGYSVRLLALENTFERCLIHLSRTGRPFQVLSCGAGFDSTYFRLKNMGILRDETCAYFEVDLPNVAADKMAAIRRQPHIVHTCLSTQPSPPVIQSLGRVGLRLGQYTLLGCDMTDAVSLWKKLGLFGFRSDRLTVVLCECSVTYIDASKASHFIRWLAARLTGHVHFMTYEQILPNDWFGCVMRNHFRSRSTPLLNVEHFPTSADQIRRLESIGLGPATSANLVDVFRQHGTGLHERLRLSKAEPSFDETEELYLKAAHYTIAQGGMPFLNNLQKHLHSKSYFLTDQNRIGTKSAVLMPAPKPCWRYGHVAHRHDDNTFVVLGGCAPASGRDNAFLWVSHSSGRVLRKDTLITKASLFSASTSAANGRFVYLFGGRNAPHEPSSTLLCVDLQSNQQREVLPASASVQPEARWKATLTCLEEDDCLVLAGGRNQSRVLPGILTYCLKSQQWKESCELPDKIGIYDHAASAFESRVFLTGGLTEDMTISEYIYVYDPRSSESRLTASLSKLTPRFGHTSSVIKSRLVLVGGVTNSGLGSVGVLDLEGGVAVEYDVDLCIERPLAAGGLYHHAVVERTKRPAREGERVEDLVMTVGGGGNCFSFGMHPNRNFLEIDVADSGR